MVGKAVADIIQTQRMGKVDIGHENGVAGGAERPSLDFDLSG